MANHLPRHEGLRDLIGAVVYALRNQRRKTGSACTSGSRVSLNSVEKTFTVSGSRSAERIWHISPSSFPKIPWWIGSPCCTKTRYSFSLAVRPQTLTVWVAPTRCLLAGSLLPEWNIAGRPPCNARRPLKLPTTLSYYIVS